MLNFPSNFKMLTAFAMTAMVPAMASAAKLANVQGAVVVSTNGTERPASSGLTLLPGDKVKTASGGYAEIIYDSGCHEMVSAKRSVVVKPEDIVNTLVPGCKTAAVPDDHLVLGVVGGAAAIGGAAILISKTKSASP